MYSIVVFLKVTPVCKECIYVLMETCPKNINVEDIIHDIKYETEKDKIHDFHLW